MHAPMPRPQSENTYPLSVKVPRSWVDLADEVAEKMSRPGVNVTRTDAIRAALWAGLQQLSQDESKKGSTKR